MRSKKIPFGQFPEITAKHPGSFAHFTIQNRFPVIIDNILLDNRYAPEIEKLLIELKNVILNEKVERALRLIRRSSILHKWAAPYRHLSWFELPFYFAEASFYRLILEISDFFSTGADPFLRRKKKEISDNLNNYVALLTQTDAVKSSVKNHSFIQYLLLQSLWGNKADLSQLKRDKRRDTEAGLIIDHAQELSIRLSAGICSVGIVLDNAGTELFTDLVLAHWLLLGGFVKQVTLYAKAWPMFVSDATENDIDNLLKSLKECDLEGLVHFGRQLAEDIKSGKISICSDPFWNSPLHFFETHKKLKAELGREDLLIFKGDANYRRIFGDRILPEPVQPELLTAYLPAKSAAVRVLKSELVSGISKAEAAAFSQKDKHWKINGRYGMIQMLN